jgi:hypothetical protein
VEAAVRQVAQRCVTGTLRDAGRVRIVPRNSKPDQARLSLILVSCATSTHAFVSQARQSTIFLDTFTSSITSEISHWTQQCAEICFVNVRYVVR